MTAPFRTPTPFACVGKSVLANGYRPIPIMPGTKSPGETNFGVWKPMHAWPQHKVGGIGPTTILCWSLWDDAGIGVILGNEVEPGWEVGCLDHDTDDLDIEDRVNSVLPRSIVEKRGARGFTGFYLFPVGTAGKRWKRGSETILELLTGNATRQSVIPPTVHPDTGLPYRWLTKATLDNTPATSLPKIDAETLERLFDTMESIPGVLPAIGDKVEPIGGEKRGAGNDYIGEINAAAMLRLGDWVPLLGLVRCRAKSNGGYEAVPHWRSGGTGHSLEERKLSLKIHPDGIRDFGADKGYNAFGLVMAARNLDFGDAYLWLEDKLGLTPDPWDCIVGEPLGDDAEALTAPPMMTVDEGVAEVERVLAAHMRAKGGVRAIRVATGIGKTSTAVRLVAEEVRRLRERKRQPKWKRVVMFSVPTHKLGNAIVEQFAKHGVTAKLFLGRTATNPETESAMCDDVDAVETALSLGANVTTSCCSGTSPKTGTAIDCKFFKTCAYQTQTNVTPDVWIVTHQMLFVAASGLGNIKSVFIDESFWSSGTWASKGGLTIDEIGAPAPLGGWCRDDMANDVSLLRAKLARGLRRQNSLGGVTRACLAAEGLTADECSTGAQAEWTFAETPALYPNMLPAARKQAAAAAAGLRHVRARNRVWIAARMLLLNEDEGAVSGRLVLVDIKTPHGVVRIVKSRGVKPISVEWRSKKIMLMDATLPDLSILTMYLPDVEIVAEIEAGMPHATIRQVVHAPVASGKLTKSTAERNLHSIRRAILHRFVEHGRQPTLVVAQKVVAEWLIETGLPEDIAVEHFGAIEGLDQYRDVRLLITVGRTMPTIFDVEDTSGTLTGVEGVKTKEPCTAHAARWYEKPAKAIRLKDGRTYAIDGEWHPDTTAEAVRWQICEAQLIQAIGRGRGVRRTAETPLAIEVWSDVVLPLAVDEVVPWSDVPSDADAEMVASGVVLNSPGDMAACWPNVWGSVQAAKDWLKQHTGGFLYSNSPIGKSPRVEFKYQHLGERQKWRAGTYEPDMVPDPRAWIEERLGVKLADFGTVQ